jgi:hypothetical protein
MMDRVHTPTPTISPVKAAPQPETPKLEEVPFVVAAGRPVSKEKKSGTWGPLLFVAVVIIGCIFLMTRQTLLTKKSEQSSLPVESPNEAFRPAQPVPSPTYPSALFASPTPTPQASALAPATPAPVAPQPPVAKVSTAPKKVAYSPVDLPALAGKGTLAISSPIAAEIFRDNQHIGSTPITFELPAGNYTFEYRNGDLRTMVTHQVKADEHSTALVTFETTVQINARPWAQVFIEGSQRRSLGHTPLSDVRVPIGRVLVFENPNFPSKSYRIPGNETTIQVVFP